MAAARRPLLACFLAAAALYAGTSFVQLPSMSAATRSTQHLGGAALGIPPALLMFPDAGYAADALAKKVTGPKLNDGVWDILTDERSSYALGISWLFVMAAEKRPLLACFLAAAALYAGASFVQLPSMSAAKRNTQQLNGAALGIPPALLMFPDAGYAADALAKKVTGPKLNDGVWDILTDERSSYALGISWLSWNTVYIGLAVFGLGSIFVFPFLYSVLLPAPSTVEDMVD
eukprot:CAMPEP_0172928948 /NCGR_PEP_ID=MMETSP1075-20121228/218235_1 /TAXON_ID=2916 /ORGANISM="Ceratium fusus, Strain PA161109" /LENGTH=231 /DNA_ID=CAMNT_0013790237 /DNA_START=55 /DNA_END=750 /DNA_ORIENTATION=-